MGYPPTFVDIQDNVIDKLRLDPDLDRQNVKDWINNNYMAACIETEFFNAVQSTSTLIADQSSVDVPASLLMLDYVVSQMSNGVYRGPMDVVGIDVILNHRAWLGGTTITQSAPQMYAFVSGPTPTIEFWPPAAGGELLTFYGSRLPPVLVEDEDVCLIPEPYGSNILEFGADQQAAEFKQNFIMLGNYAQTSQYWLQRFRGFLNERRGNQVQQMNVVHHRVRYPAVNSIDLRTSW